MTSRSILRAAALTLIVSGAQAQQAPASPGVSPSTPAVATPWLTSLKTDSPQAGYELAVRLSRAAVRMMQPDADKRRAARSAYELDAAALIAASHVVAVHFATISAANNHWRSP